MNDEKARDKAREAVEAGREAWLEWMREILRSEGWEGEDLEDKLKDMEADK